ncbi:MAG: hypothetical protein WAK96_11470, partial [Desulfobaccales bacterium]
FMHEWSILEMQLLFLFDTLIGTPMDIARIIFASGFQTPNLIDLFIALGQIRLLKEEQHKLNSLCKRYSKFAGKRNKIVHGSWYTESHSNSPSALQWTRIYSPVSLITQAEIFNKRNQKMRSRYRFTIKQLQIARNQISILTSDIRQFTGLIMNRLYPEGLP